MDEASIRAALVGLPVPDLRYFSSIGSTNDEGLRWAENGAADGSLVVADTQTAGRGRMGRHWVTRPGVSLAFSLVLRPEEKDSSLLGLYSPLGALGLSEALKTVYGLEARIKWPNDVLLDGMKMAGLLVEATWLGNQIQSVILGIGVNIAPESVPPAETLLFPATSVERALGRPVNRVQLLRAILEHLFQWRQSLATPTFLRAWESRLAFQGEWVEVQQPDQQVVTGKVLGVSPDGNLRLEDPEGKVISVTAGDVRLRPVR